MRQPDKYGADQIKSWNVEKELPSGKWVLARLYRSNCHTFCWRFKMAWLVITGQADVLTWEEELDSDGELPVIIEINDAEGDTWITKNDSEKIVTLVLNEEKANWLKGLMQNPIFVENPQDESNYDKSMRKEFWILLGGNL